MLDSRSVVSQISQQHAKDTFWIKWSEQRATQQRQEEHLYGCNNRSKKEKKVFCTTGKIEL